MKDYVTYLEDRYSDKISFKLIEKDTENFYKSNSLAVCYDMGLKLYTSDNYQVQEVLAKAFDNYCRMVGYEAALPVIKDWLESDVANTRRSVSEGLRIWTGRPYFKENP